MFRSFGYHIWMNFGMVLPQSCTILQRFTECFWEGECEVIGKPFCLCVCRESEKRDKDTKTQKHTHNTRGLIILTYNHKSKKQFHVDKRQ